MPKLLFLFIFLIVFIFSSCQEDEDVYSPKPRGYPRIKFPEKTYRMFDSTCAYKFEIPTYVKVNSDGQSKNEPCWFNLDYLQFRATVHLSYKQVENNIERYIDDSHNFANKHQIKATGLEETVIIRDSAKVYGLLFDIAGNTASSLQFYITDSTKHFVRGALYFNCVPNIDSLKIVVDFIREDLIHLINTATWKNEAYYPKETTPRYCAIIPKKNN